MASWDFSKEDRRRFPRVPVSMTVETQQDQKIIFGYARDLSEEGLCVTASIVEEGKELPNISQIMKITFKIPKSNQVISCKARVVRIDLSDDQPPVIALNFIHIDSHMRSSIDLYIKEFFSS
ncbi:MAG: PilZ domain-containing protein [Bdellovibrionota bacterium]